MGSRIFARRRIDWAVRKRQNGQPSRKPAGTAGSRPNTALSPRGQKAGVLFFVNVDVNQLIGINEINSLELSTGRTNRSGSRGRFIKWRKQNGRPSVAA